jgi:hypothetical protein
MYARKAQDLICPWLWGWWEVMRQPLEDGAVTIARAAIQYRTLDRSYWA